jgi:hypothetical protein
MIMLALAPPSIAVVSFDHRCTTPTPHVATGRPGSSLHRSPSKQAFNAPRQQTASVEIPIASDARPRHTSRGFLPWRFAYAGPGVRRATIMGPASANLHKSGHSLALVLRRLSGSIPATSSNAPMLRIRSSRRTARPRLFPSPQQRPVLPLVLVIRAFSGPAEQFRAAAPRWCGRRIKIVRLLGDQRLRSEN